jgi:hypothetical protein
VGLGAARARGPQASKEVRTWETHITVCEGSSCRSSLACSFCMHGLGPGSADLSLAIRLQRGKMLAR